MTWAGVGLSVVSLYFALRGTDLRAIGVTLAGAHLWFVVPLVVAQILFYALKAWRWRLMLKPIQSVPTRKLVAPMMIGFMGNNLLPAHLGELIRVFLGAQLLKLAPSQLLASLVLERIFDFTAVLALFAWGAIVIPGVPRELVAAGYLSAAASAVGMFGAAVYVIWTEPMLRLAAWCTSLLPEKVRRAILDQLELGASGMGALRQPTLLAGVVLTSLLQWFLMSVCIYVSLRAMDAFAPAPASFIVLAATVLGVMVPAAPGFFGTLELTFVLALRPFMVEESRAMAAAVFYHVIPYLGVTLVGLFFLRQAGLRLREIENDAVESRDQAAESSARATALA
jgi:uncharacterized protein (TIRG00374 family)